ncbi:cupin domain-containing protein [Tianweitania populi]|nr:cupin domain-containing protein [Tianweitania populi]
MKKAIIAADAAPRIKPSNYPEPFASMMDGRIKRPLGDLFGLKNFGVNLTRLTPGAVSALHHRHSRQDEFVYILEGEPTIYLGEKSERLTAGMCIGFPAAGEAHHLKNDTAFDVVILEIGDRSSGDEVSYPTDDLVGIKTTDGWAFEHKNGDAYPASHAAKA